MWSELRSKRLVSLGSSGAAGGRKAAWAVKEASRVSLETQTEARSVSSGLARGSAFHVICATRDRAPIRAPKRPGQPSETPVLR